MSENSVLEKCAGCTRTLPKKEFLRCAFCKAAYDLDCANVSSKRYNSFYALDKQRKASWKCPECQSKVPKTGNANTPVRMAVQDDHEHHTAQMESPHKSNVNHVTVRTKSNQQFSVESQESNLSCDLIQTEESDGTKVSARGIMAELKLFSEEMRAARVEMGIFRETVSTLTATIKEQNIRIDRLENRIEILESRISETHKCSVSDMEDTIMQLRMEIQDKSQEMLVNDVEIAGFPEVANENSVHAILHIARKVGVQLEDRDVVCAERLGAPRAFVEGEGAPRPRPLAVRLARRDTRDALLAAARVRRRLTTEGMSLSGATKQFYVNERLTRHNRQLFQRARELAGRMSWRYVWTRGGRIYVRQEHGKDRHRIQSESDLSKVFGNS